MKLKTTNIYVTGNDDPVIENVAFGTELTVTTEVTDTEENKAHTWYKITGQTNSTKTSKISFTTTQDNVNISFKIKSSSESNYDYVYLTEIDSTNTQYNSSIVNKVSGDGTEKVVDYVVQKAGDHYIYVCYRKDGSGNSYNDCGYVCLLTRVGIPVTEIKSVYVENSKVQQMNVQGKNLFEYGFGNTISWETLNWVSSSNSYTYNSKEMLTLSYYNTGLLGGVKYAYLLESPASTPNNNEIDLVNFKSSYKGNSYNFTYKLDLSDWDTSNITRMNYMFQDCYALTYIDASNFNTSKVDQMYGMFQNCYALTYIDVSGFDTGNVNNMEYMFTYCRSLTYLDVSNFNTSKLNRMDHIFAGTGKINLIDISKWDLSHVDKYYFNNLFTNSDCENIKLPNMNLDNLTNSNYGDSFVFLTYLKSLQAPELVNSKITNVSALFNGDKELEYIDMHDWDFSNVNNFTMMFSQTKIGENISMDLSKSSGTLSSMFLNSTANIIDVSNIITSSKINITRYMFQGAKATVINIVDSNGNTNFDTSGVTYMEKMFNNCINLVNINGLDKLNISNVTKMDGMFSGCSKLTNIDISSWDFSNVNSVNGSWLSDELFYNCISLTTLIDGHELEENITVFNGLKVSLSIKNSKNLNYESVYALFRGVATVTTTQTITLPPIMKGKLDVDKIKIATDKGWKIEYSY